MQKIKNMTYPNMRKSGAERLFTISPSGLRGNCDDGHQDSYHAVLKDTRPDDLEIPLISSQLV